MDRLLGSRPAGRLRLGSAPGPLLGLRIDVDTHAGLRDGVPRLLDLLREAKARGTFYVAMGPDRSGLAVLNALRPGFLAKMRRTGAVLSQIQEASCWI